MAKVDGTKINYKLIISITIATLFVFATFIGIWLLKRSDANRGTFGDLFGSVNALYSGLAFIGVVYAILLQREELSLQRQELQETRKELKRTADAQEKTEVQLDKQNKFNQITAQLNASTALLELYTKKLLSANDNKIGNWYKLGAKEYQEKVNELSKEIELLLAECKSLKT